MSGDRLYRRLAAVHFDTEDRQRLEALGLRDDIVRGHLNLLERRDDAPPATVLVELVRHLVESNARKTALITRYQENYAVPLTFTFPAPSPEETAKNRAAYEAILKSIGAKPPTSEGT